MTVSVRVRVGGVRVRERERERRRAEEDVLLFNAYTCCPTTNKPEPSSSGSFTDNQSGQKKNVRQSARFVALVGYGNVQSETGGGGEREREREREIPQKRQVKTRHDTTRHDKIRHDTT